MTTEEKATGSGKLVNANSSKSWRSQTNLIILDYLLQIDYIIFNSTKWMWEFNLLHFSSLRSAFISTWMLLIHKLMIIKSLQLAACSKYQSTTKDEWLYRNNEPALMLKISFLSSRFLFSSLTSFFWVRGKKNNRKLLEIIPRAFPTHRSERVSIVNLPLNLTLKLFILQN